MFKKSSFLLAVIFIFFLGVYFWSAAPTQSGVAVSPRFDWPDEVANYFWVSHYARSGSLVVPEELNAETGNQIHPRSFNVRSDGALVPGSFLGLILLYGLFAKLVGTQAMLYFTPLLGVLAAGALFGILKHIFDQRIALVSAILLLIHPAWWYYSVTTMLPNVPFIAFLLFSLYILFSRPKLSWLAVGSAGVLLGVSLSFRPAEFIWVAAVVFTALFYLREKFTGLKLIAFFVIVVASVLPSLYYQQLLYDNFLTSGYSQLEAETIGSCTSCEVVRSLVLPFGFHPTLVALNLWTHVVSRLWWLALLAVLGFVAYVVRQEKHKPEIFGYVLLSIFVFGWLGVYYGSWEFTDKLTLHLNTLGISYVRYFLPLFILSLPFIARGLIWLSMFLKSRWRGVGIVVMLVVLAYLSAQLTLFKHPDSIFPVKERIVSYKKVASRVMAETEPDAIIVTVRKDKVFFPERRVIHTFEALSVNRSLASLLSAIIDQVPVYYYALGPEPVLELDGKLRLVQLDRIGGEVLYRVEKNLE